MITKSPPEVLTPEDMAYISTLNERARRQFFATKAVFFRQQGVSINKISKIMKTSKNTIYKGIQELRTDTSLPKDSVRCPGGGRKTLLSRHPEWIEALKVVIEPYIAGLPQDSNVIWVSISVPQISREIAKNGYDISEYIVRQILDSLGFRHRSFIKDLPMKDVQDRDAQFQHIASTRTACEDIGLPIISIDTKKKELIGNFKRNGKVPCKGQPKSLDHDFATFSDGKIVPHGIYDVIKNVGYMTIGTNHDTSKFVCDNIHSVWEQHLQEQYPSAQTLVIICDGGGSNASAHRIVKQDLMNLADRLNMNLLVMHYPPYCSKFNPIEHRLFSHITRSWSGAPLLSVEDAAKRAAGTTTSKGLTVKVDINVKMYEIQRPIDKEYQKRVEKRIVFYQKIPKWNYLIKPALFVPTYFLMITKTNVLLPNL
jgi:transposase